MSSAKIDILHMFLNAGPVVQMVLLLLILFSISSWAIILIKYRYMRRAFRESALFIEFFWKSRDLTDAFSKSKQLQGSPVARIFRVAYLELRKLSKHGSTTNARRGPNEKSSLGARTGGIDNVKRALRRAINTETTRMTQMVPFLATTGNTTPFIGLFGTVWGIMNSFHGIGQMGSASLAVVAPGISEALVATAVGLAAAIPAVIAFNFFMSKIRTLESELVSFSQDFLNVVERDIFSRQGGA
ncbi:MAG: protein TolQ [Desulfobacterales bacterium]